MIVLFTDTDTDITLEEANELGYKLISMPYSINDEEILPYETWKEFKAHEFYDSLRNGVLPKTSAISSEKYIEYFEPVFKEGNDILYVHFSTAMSGTFNAMNVALEDLKERYPERKFYEIDTKGITINSYSPVIEIQKKFKEGMPIEELLEYGKDLAEHTATYFFADSLKFFQHSGRVSNIKAVMGTLFSVKPIIYMDQNGMMTSVSKAKGRKGALQKIVEYVKELGDHIEDHPIIVGHTDNEPIANELKDLLKETFGQNLDIKIVMVNPTAGSHCGPDGIGVCFHAIHR